MNLKENTGVEVPQEGMETKIETGYICNYIKTKKLKNKKMFNILIIYENFQSIFLIDILYGLCELKILSVIWDFIICLSAVYLKEDI